MKNPFSRKTPQQRRDAVAAQLVEAESQAKSAQDERLKLAMAGEDTSKAEEQSWKLAARAKTLTDALAALDQEIADNERAEVERQRRQRHDKAAAIVRQRHDEAVELRTKLVGLVNEARKACAAHDITMVGFRRYAIIDAAGEFNL